MKRIPLSQGYFALVDDEDAEFLSTRIWIMCGGYAVNNYVNEDGKRCRRWMHREIAENILGEKIPNGIQIDHVNSIAQGEAARLDNRRENLRLATRSQNQANKNSQMNSKSGHKGVTLRNGKFDVRLRYYHHRLNAGRYTNFDLAVAAYGYAHRILWREFTSEGQGTIPLPAAIQAKIDQQIVAFLKKVSSV